MHKVQRLVELRALAVVFVLIVRRDAEFRDAVHLVGANLHLKRHPVVADHGVVQRLIAVGLGHRDIVLETPLHRLPEGMNNA